MVECHSLHPFHWERISGENRILCRLPQSHRGTPVLCIKSEFLVVNAKVPWSIIKTKILLPK